MIFTANWELLTAIFTFHVRAERFSEGSWSSAIEEKVFLSILKRLEKLV